MTKIKFFLVVSFFLLGALIGFAQPGGGRPPGGGPPCSNPPCNPVPITGIEVLIAMGGVLGCRALVKKINK